MPTTSNSATDRAENNLPARPCRAPGAPLNTAGSLGDGNYWLVFRTENNSMDSARRCSSRRRSRALIRGPSTCGSGTIAGARSRDSRAVSLSGMMTSGAKRSGTSMTRGVVSAGGSCGARVAAAVVINAGGGGATAVGSSCGAGRGATAASTGRFDGAAGTGTGWGCGHTRPRTSAITVLTLSATTPRRGRSAPRQRRDNTNGAKF